MDKIQKANDKFKELKEQFIEMGQLKSDFDIEKFTVKKEGHFIAHQFHFLMRQYSLALYELRRMLYDREEKLRRRKEYSAKLEQDINTIIVLGEKGQEEKYTDIEIGRLTNEIDLLEISMANKLAMVTYFEKARKEIIKLNGREITNKQYQEEVPAYWRWYLSNRAVWQAKEKITGIREGVWENIDHLEQPALLNPAFQVLMLSSKGLLDLKKLERELELEKGIPERVENILKGNGELVDA